VANHLVSFKHYRYTPNIKDKGKTGDNPHGQIKGIFGGLYDQKHPLTIKNE
jgi:hypothetical protein